MPEPGPGEVLVEVAGCGLCHSDLMMIEMPGELGELWAGGCRSPSAMSNGGAGPRLGDGVTGFAGAIGGAPPPSSCGRCDTASPAARAVRSGAKTGRGYGRDGGWPARSSRRPASCWPWADLSPGSPVRSPTRERPRTTRCAGPAGARRRARPPWCRRRRPLSLVSRCPDPAGPPARPGRGGRHGCDQAGHRPELGAAEAFEAVPTGSRRTAVLDIVDNDAHDHRRRARRGPPRRCVRARRFGGGGYRRPWFDGLPHEATITAVQRSSIDDAPRRSSRSPPTAGCGSRSTSTRWPG